MGSFSENLETIRAGVYGSDIRQAIYDCLNELKENIESISQESILPNAEDGSF